MPCFQCYESPKGSLPADPYPPIGSISSLHRNSHEQQNPDQTLSSPHVNYMWDLLCRPCPYISPVFSSSSGNSGSIPVSTVSCWLASFTRRAAVKFTCILAGSCVLSTIYTSTTAAVKQLRKQQSFTIVLLGLTFSLLLDLAWEKMQLIYLIIAI